MHRRNSLPLIVMVLALVPGLVAHAQTRSERLISGDQKTLSPGYAVGDVAISNPDVCDFRIVSNRRELMLIATGPGVTTLTIWDQRGVKRDEVAIEVVSREYAKLMTDLTELVRPYPEVTVKSLGNGIVLAGSVNTALELEAIRAFASADSRILSTVTLKGAASPAADAVPPTAPRSVAPTIPSPAEGPASMAPRPTSPPLPTTPSIVVDPTPPPPARAVPNAPAPVPLAPSAPTPVAPSPASTPPAAVPAAPAPPPPNVTPVDASRLSPGPGTPRVSASAEATSIEYQIEIYESPASAPPPEVMGPQGTRLFTGRLITGAGTEAQQLVTVGEKAATPATMRGIRVAVTPTLAGPAVHTAVVIDTNLPVGQYSQQKTPVWLRAQISFSAPSGQKHYITEAELARVATPTGAPPAVAAGGGAAGRIAEKAADAGASIVSSATGVGFIPSLGGLFGGGGAKPPKSRPTMLLIVVTASVVDRLPQ